MNPKTDVLLIFPQPGFFDFAEGLRELPNALLAIADPCLKQGYSVKIVDQRVPGDWKEKALPHLKSGPACVGISTRTGPQLQQTIQTAQWIKENFPQISIVVGGPHVTMLPEQVLSSDYIDVVVPYEGEETFPELVEALSNGRDLSTVNGIFFKRDGRIVNTPDRLPVDINVIPTLPYDLVDINDYISVIGGQSGVSFFPDRGCQYRCSFCNVNDYNLGGTVRMMGAENLFRNMQAISKLGVTLLAMGDSNFMGYRKRLRELVELLENEDLGLKIKCSARVDDINSLDDEFLIRLKNVGFFAFQIGVESGSDKVLESMQKKITVADVRKANEKMKRTGQIPIYSFMGGVPGETLDDGQKTLELMVEIAESNPLAKMSNMQLYRIFPGGSGFWLQVAEKYGLRAPDTLESWYQLYPFNHPWLSDKELKTFKKWHQLSLFVEVQSIIDFYPRAWSRILLRIYSKIVKFRIKKRFYHFMPELKIVDWLS